MNNKSIQFNIPDNPIILFDGICNFCNSSVNFIIKRDYKNIFEFSPLQSDFTKELKNTVKIPDEIDSIILIQNGICYTKSNAVLKITKQFGGLWKIFYFLIIIPKFLRNFFYDIIARNRYKWFGKKDVCMIPTKEIINKFL